ncbi:MAG: ABC transporter ATP-binding protein [Phycisphaerales bacterium]|nr:MAG: ABC transporter ATP-binding protein [Phycisphaerales bacterium]
MTAITLKGLTKRFGATTAVDSVDLSITSGQLFFLLGPSGCGKTTLLRMIAGFIEPTAGSIHFDERNVTGLPPNKRNTGMVFQSYALWPHMTVLDNVAYGLKVRKITAAERSGRVMKALDTVRMGDYVKRKPNELSGGQQQRVALARALVIEPTVLLLDEPLSNLDAKLRLEMRSEIRRICKATGITTVYVTHDQKEALSMADSVAVLREGRTVQIGPPRTLYDRPASRFVADFLGETNFLAAVVAGAEEGMVTLETPAGLLHSTAGVAKTPQGGNVTCSIRPEALSVTESGSGRNCLHGKRLQTTYLGEIAQHLIELADGSSVKVLQLNPSHLDQPGEEMHLQVDPDDVVILAD